MKKCEINELDRIFDFYRSVSERTEKIRSLCRWEYGLYPADDIIEPYIRRGEMFYSEKDGGIVAAVAVTPYQTENYHGVDWRKELNDDEVAVVHLLAVDPHYHRNGIAKNVMKEIIASAKSEGKKAVRLDALSCNTPAHKLYESLGFVKRDVRSWYAPNTGSIVFCLFEYLLD